MSPRLTGKALLAKGRKWLHSSSGDSMWLLAQSIYTMALGLVMTGLAARVYGPNLFGVLAVAIALTVVVSPLATLGMDIVVVHALVRDHAPEATVLRTSMALRLGASAVLLFIIALVTALVDQKALRPAVVLAMGLALVLRTGEGYLPWFQAKSQIPRSSLARILAYSVTTGARGVVLLGGLPIEVYALTYALDAGLVWALLAVSRRRIVGGVEGTVSISRPVGRSILSRSWPLAISGLAVAVYNRVDQLMLGVMLADQDDVGRYAAAVTLAESWYFAPLAVVVARQAGVMRSHAESAHAFYREAQRLFDVAVRLGVVCATLVAVLSPIAITVLFGADYTTNASIASAVLLAGAGLLAVAGSARGPWLIANGLEKYTLIYLCGGAITNVSLNLLLIPAFGIVGAAAATLAAQSLSVLILPAIIPATRPTVGLMLSAVNPLRMTRLHSGSTRSGEGRASQ